MGILTNVWMPYQHTLQTRIFRKDYDLAKTLPLAIAAAKEVKESKEYLELATQFAEKIVANTDNTDWSLRFFAAQTFVELYELGKDQQHLKKAYAIDLPPDPCASPRVS